MAFFERALIVGVLYGVCAEVSFILSHSFSLGVSIFPAAGVSAVGLLLSPRRSWPLICLTLGLVEYSIDIAHRAPVLVSAGYTFANVVEPIIAVVLIQTFGDRPFDLEKVRSITALATASVSAPMASGLLAGTVASIAGVAEFWQKWQSWWSEDAIGSLAAACVLVAWSHRRHVGVRVAVAVLSMISGIGLLLYLIGSHQAPVAFLLGPLLCWAAVRSGPVGVSVAGLLVAVGGEWSAWRGIGPFAGGGSHDSRVILTQVFVGATLLSVLLLHAALTQRNVSAQQLGDLETIGRVAGGVAHDVNNLVSVILINCELLFERLDPADSKWVQLERIERAAEKARSVAAKLQSVGRRTDDADGPCDLNAVVSGMEQVLRGGFTDTVLEVRLAHSELPVHIGPASLEQILLNLVVNAKEACRGQGWVRVETGPGSNPGHRSASGFTELRVSDNGRGMPRNVLDRAFDPWFTTKETKTHGMGLASVASLVKQAGGTVMLSSEVQAGTAVTVYLPTAVRVEAAEPVTGVGSAMLQAGTALVCALDGGERRAIRALLRGRGLTVLEASTGGEALDLARRHDGPIHLLIADVMMAGLTGPSVAARMGVERPGLAVVLILDFPDEGLVGLLPGPVATLVKPFTDERLLEVVRAVRPSVELPVALGA